MKTSIAMLITTTTSLLTKSLNSFKILPTLPRITTTLKMSTSSSNIKSLKIALLQFKVSESKPQNLQKATSFLSTAAAKKATLAVLPEIWNSPYATTAFPEYAELVPSVGDGLGDLEYDVEENPSAKLLMEKAVEYGIWIIGGSIPERILEDNQELIYNTCLCINPHGVIVAKHRKVHLFDIDVPNKITFRESDTLSPGTALTDFDLLGVRVGVGICYDIRFPELVQCLVKRGCRIIVFPGAFNLITGPAHWELLQRARAVDGQCFVLSASPARSDPVDGGKYPYYAAWGHSTAVSPWGEVIATCDETEQIVYADLNLEDVEEMRRNIPTMMQKRDDLYSLKDLQKD